MATTSTPANILREAEHHRRSHTSERQGRVEGPCPQRQHKNMLRSRFTGGHNYRQVMDYSRGGGDRRRQQHRAGGNDDDVARGESVVGGPYTTALHGRVQRGGQHHQKRRRHHHDDRHARVHRHDGESHHGHSPNRYRVGRRQDVTAAPLPTVQQRGGVDYRSKMGDPTTSDTVAKMINDDMVDGVAVSVANVNVGVPQELQVSAHPLSTHASGDRAAMEILGRHDRIHTAACARFSIGRPLPPPPPPPHHA